MKGIKDTLIEEETIFNLKVTLNSLPKDPPSRANLWREMDKK